MKSGQVKITSTAVADLSLDRTGAHHESAVVFTFYEFSGANEVFRGCFWFAEFLILAPTVLLWAFVYVLFDFEFRLIFFRVNRVCSCRSSSTRPVRILWRKERSYKDDAQVGHHPKNNLPFSWE